MSCKKTGMYFYMMGKYPLFIEILHFLKHFFCRFSCSLCPLAQMQCCGTLNQHFNPFSFTLSI